MTSAAPIHKIIGGSFMVGPFLDILLIEVSKPPLVPHS